MVATSLRLARGYDGRFGRLARRVLRVEFLFAPSWLLVVLSGARSVRLGGGRASPRMLRTLDEVELVEEL